MDGKEWGKYFRPGIGWCPGEKLGFALEVDAQRSSQRHRLTADDTRRSVCVSDGFGDLSLMGGFEWCIMRDMELDGTEVSVCVLMYVM